MLHSRVTAGHSRARGLVGASWADHPGRVGLWSELAELLLPPTCAGCGAETVSLCGVCLSHLDSPPRWSLPRYGTQRVCGAGEYTGVLREVLVSYKARDRRDVLPVLGLVLARTIVAALAESAGVEPARGLVLVPVPASARSARERGGNHVAALAGAACRLLGADGLDARVGELLRVRGAHRDQVGQGSRGRRANVRGTHAVADPAAARRLVALRPVVVLVDDICTTGATLAEAARALGRVQIQVDSIAVLAITGDAAHRDTPAGM